ncbi:hypothetical protein [Exiguobacterium sp.]|uniref:O-antigen ligase family protein n=2 Tax=unclassified Exiguobacterium TaxID=2644629 RepID=UPI002898526E|nr:hypothetical protein [Exiguobacterium sp.]
MKNKILIILNGLLFLAFYFAYQKENQFAFILNLKYIIFMIICIYILVFYKVQKQKILIQIIYMLLAITFCVIPIIGLINFSNIQIFYNMALYFIYILYLYLMTCVVTQENLVSKLITLFFYITLIYLVYLIFSTQISLFNISDIKNAFNLDDRIRQDFGLKHANTAGLIGFVGILLCTYKMYFDNKKNFLVYLLGIVVPIIIILNSGSRTALTGVLIFWMVLIYKHYKKNLRTRFKNVYFILLWISLLFSIFTYLIYSNLNYSIILENSNRYYGWVNTFDYINQFNNIIVGTGFVNISYFYDNINTIIITDNWYIYTYMTLGLLGIIVMVILLISLFIYFIKDFRKNKDKNVIKMNIYVYSIFVSCMYYAIFEITLMVPSEIISLLLWLLIGFYIANSKKGIVS